jgi:hypothetical protein
MQLINEFIVWTHCRLIGFSIYFFCKGSIPCNYYLSNYSQNPCLHIVIERKVKNVFQEKNADYLFIDMQHNNELILQIDRDAIDLSPYN